ncbi:MAG: osmoprotectant ABC transporter substrate-binding protein [Erysipelothrix sp.]|nr:osmoprotectant ABC transporter substrate-binding protein [Erysipelothrix sp.]
MKKLKSILLIIIMTLSLSACSLPGLGANVSKNDIVIAGGSTSERQILAQISVQMMNYHLPEVKTDLINNLGSSLLILQTMTGGDTNISGAMYTGTSLTGELNQQAIKDPQLALSRVIKGYYEKYDMVWFPTYGFENTYAFMVRKDFAKEYNLTKVSDLREMASDLKAGVDTGWIDRQGDGYEDFKKLYQFDFDKVYPMQIGLVYEAVAAKEMDIVLGYSSDGRIQANNLQLLEDDLQLFPPYDASPVATMALLQEHPEVIEILLKIEGSISSSDMQELNRISDEDKVEAKIIAKNFLEKNDYFNNKVVIPLEDRDDYKEIMKDLNQRISKENE